MDSAFLPLPSRPATGTLSLSAPGRSGAWSTSDGGVPRVVQGMMRKTVVLEVAPHLVTAPGGHRVDLEDPLTVDVRVSEDRAPGTTRGGIPPHGCDPAIKRRE